MARADSRAAPWVLAAGLSTTVAMAQVPPPASASATQQQWISVWVDLDLPELASLPAASDAERAVLRGRLLAQQAEVMARLRELGAVEQARVQQVRNALAVRLPGAQLEEARRIPGVRAVRTVRHVDRGPLVQGN